MARASRSEPGGEAPVDLNTASREDLEGIEGVAGHAFEIVRTREERGGFTSVEQLEEVPGFAGKLTDAIRRRLTVGPPAERG